MAGRAASSSPYLAWSAFIAILACLGALALLIGFHEDVEPQDETPPDSA